MAVKIHVLLARVTSNVASFVTGMGKASSATKTLRTTWIAASRDITSASNRIGLAVIGMGVIFAKTFAEFESTMIRVGAVTDTLGTKTFERLTKAAREAGRTTQFTARQSAQAMEKLGLAGLDANEVIGALAPTLQLASAAQLEISEAATISSKTMRAFGFEVKDLNRINDTLIAGFTNANLTLPELFNGLAKVGSTATTAGVSLEDTVAALGKMADAGVDASISGNALRNVLLALQAPTAKARKGLAEFGINVDAINPKAVPLVEILERLAAAGIDSGLAAEIFGRRGGPQMVAAFSAGVTGIRDFSTELDKARGISLSLFEENLKSLKSQMAILKSEITDIVLEIGIRLKPTFMKMIEIVRENKKQIQSMAEGMGRLIEAIVRLVAEHPRVAGFLLLFKISSLLGITRAVLSLALAFSALARSLFIMATSTNMVAFFAFMKKGLISLALQAIGTAIEIGVLKAAMFGLAGIAVASIFAVIIFKLKKLNEQLRESINLTNKLRDEEEVQAEKRLANIKKIKDPQTRLDALEMEKDKLARLSTQRRENADAILEESQRLDTLGDKFIGASGIQAELAEKERQGANRIAEKLNAIDSLIVTGKMDVKNKGKGKPQPANRPPVPPGLFGPVPGKGGQGHIPKVPVSQQAKRTAQLALAMNAGTISLKKFNAEMKRLEHDIIQNDLNVARNELVQDRLAGKISIDEFKVGIQEWQLAVTQANLDLAQQKAKLIQQAQEEKRQRFDIAKQSTQGIIENLRKIEGPTKAYTDRLDKVANAFIQGKLSQEKFTIAINKMVEATKQAIAAEDIARKRRLLAGKGTKADKAFLQKQVSLALTGQLNSNFQNMVNNLAGVNKKTGNLSKGFGSLKKNVDKFGKVLTKAGKQAKPTAQQINAALQGLSRVFATRAGRAALLQSNIALLRQALAFTGRGFRGGNARRRAQILEQINGHLRELNGLLKTPAPGIINSRLGLQGLIDPGLQREQSGAAGAGGVNLTINTTAVDGRTIIREAELALQERGRRI